MLRFVIVTELHQLPIESQKRIFAIPKSTAVDVHFTLKNPEWFKESERPLDRFDGLIGRPNDGLTITNEDFGGITRPFVAATLSTGTDHLQLDGLDNVRVISSRNGNADSVAKWTIDMASELRRNYRSHAQVAARGSWHQSHRVRQDEHASYPALLDDQTWVALGAGKQIESLVPSLCDNRVKRIVVYDYKANRSRLQDCLSQIDSRLHGEITDIEAPSFSKSIEPSNGEVVHWVRTQLSIRPNRETEIFSTSAWPGCYAHTADFLSVHLPYKKSTHGFVSRKVIEKLPSTACVLVASRGDIADEQAIVEQYDSGRLLGVAADTVVQEAERQKDSKLSPLWSYYRRANETGEPHNVIVTPHIAGTSASDTNKIVDEVASQIERAITQLVNVSN